MKSLHFAFSPRAAFSAVAALVLFCPGPARAQRLPTTVVPTHYTLKLTPDLKTATFSGVEAIDMNIGQPTRSVTLNAIEIAFQSVTIYPNGPQQTGTVSLDPEKQQATFTFPNMIPAGNATIKIRYTGILNNELRGFYLSTTAKRNYAVTQLEATDARRAFPCFDEPAFKATFGVSLTIDAGDTAISNTAIASDTPGPGPGKHTLRFGVTPKMSTYLVALLVGDFQCASSEQDGVALRVCSTPDKIALAPFALSVARFALRYYDNYFGIHYPLKKLDLIAIPDFESGAMENFGAITFREEYLLLDPKSASIDSQRQAAVVICHEISHQWFGDLVTMQWWDNIWLNEGFASWMEDKPVAAMHPEWNVPELVAHDEQTTIDVDSQPATRPMRAKADTPGEINQMFDSIAYGKAGDVLLMLEHYLGEETFRKGVHAYLAAHQYGNATAEDFWNAQTAASHKPVDKIMESLVAQPGVPVLAFGAPAGGLVPVAQRRFFLSHAIAPNPAQRWTLPVCFKIAAGAADCRLLTPDARELRVPEGGLFFADAGGKGYYRAAYAPAQYAALMAQAETALTPAERIGLAGGEWAQVRANQATVGDYLDMAAALRADPNAGVLSTAVKPIAAIMDQVAATKDERDELAAWARRTFAPEYKRRGPPAPGEAPNISELRARLLSLLGNQGGDAEVIEQAREIAGKSLDDPGSVDPNLARDALRIAAEQGDETLFGRLQRVYETSTDPDRQQFALELLVEFRNPALLERGLEYSVSSKVRNQDSAVVLSTALQTPQNRDAAWSFIKTHWGQVQAELTTSLGAYLVEYSDGFCTAEARDDVRSFYAAHPVAASDVSLQHALDRIDGCIELRRLQEPNLRQWLAAHGAS